MIPHKITLSFRALFFLGGIACLSILGGAYLIEYRFKIEPCSLCILQRYVAWGMTVIFLIGALHNCKFWGRILYCATVTLFGITGFLIAARHVWLQYAPHPPTATCAAGLEQMLSFMPLLEVLKEVLTTHNACSQVDFMLLHLSLATWSLLFFLELTLFSILILSLQIQRRI